MFVVDWIELDNALKHHTAGLDKQACVMLMKESTNGIRVLNGEVLRQIEG